MSQVEFSAAAGVSIGSPAPFKVGLDIPAAYNHVVSAAPDLVYPIEVAAISNWDMPTKGGISGADDVWPRIDLMPSSGVVLWILQGDVGFDYQAVPAQGDWFIPGAYTYLASQRQPIQAQVAGAPQVVASERALGGPDVIGSPWLGSNVWARLVPLAGPRNEPSQQPPYLMIYQFAGTGEPPLPEVEAMVNSLEVIFE